MHEWMRRLLLAREKGIGFKPGAEGDAFVGHDQGCATERGLDCNCDPDIRVVFGSLSYRVFKDGVWIREH